MSKNESKLTTKLSPLIEGQVPDFVQADHPVFVRFLKHYYQFLEAGRLTLTATVNYVRQETTTVNYILTEEDGSRIATESGDGTTGIFTEGETVLGATSKATATVLVDDSRNSYVYISTQQKFITGETITGQTSGASGTLDEYRANPIQNIQQLLEYANTDNTLYDFLDQFKNSFMNAIPETLASGVSKRNLIKNIKDLYAAKGTSEGHKLFMRLFVGEQPEIFYPTEYMLRLSDGNWGTKTVLRCQPVGTVDGEEIVDQLITGASSGATAIVNAALSFQEGTASITEFEISNISGTFTSGEIISATSNTRDVDIKFTITSVLSSGAVVNDGILHTDAEDITVESVGNGFASAVVSGIEEGSVDGVEVDDVGSLYEVGDTLTFTAASADTDAVSASGFVSMVGGGILQETGTLDDSTITTDTIIIEDGSQTHLESFKFILEDILDENFIGDGSTTVFTLTNLNSTTDTILITVDNEVFPETNPSLETPTNWTVSGTTLTFTTAPEDDAKIYVRGNAINNLILERTDSTGTDAGHQILTEETIELEDTHTTNTDQIVLEFDTFKNIDPSSTESGAIQKVHVADGGGGYTDLPTVTITTTTGTGGALLATTDTIGAVKSIKVTNPGFNYSTTNTPDLTLRAHFVLKDVTGTFAAENTLTTHTGTVKGFDSNTNVLDTTFENVVRVTQEQTSAFNQGIELEDAAQDLSDNDQSILLEDVQDFDDGEDILLDGTSVFTPTPKTYTKKVKVIRNTADTANIFEIDGVPQPTLRLTEGNTYYFDLSDSSLYNAVTTKNHQLRFSTTSDGTHGSGSAYTTGVTTSASYIEIGTTGAYIQIVVATDAPDLYYYCVNHSGMGGFAYTPEPVSFVQDEGDKVLLDGDQTALFSILLETDTIGFLRQEGSKNTRASRIGFDQTAAGGADQNSNVLLEDAANEGISGAIIIMEDSEDRFVTSSIADAGDTFLLERSDFNFVDNDLGNSVLKLNRYQEKNGNDFLLYDGFDSDSLGSGDRVATSESGKNIILDGTDSDKTDANQNVLFENETSVGDIILDGTDSDLNDAGDNIVNEDGIDFSQKNVTITDSSGASGTIVKADIATATSSVDTTATSEGSYSGIDSLIGEDLIRVQDSYYYQDYSYEVQVGEAFGTYVNELKKAVHPAGFQPFGKVSIATTISAAIRNTGTDLSGFTGDETFSPILASTFTNLFDQVIQSRLEVAPDGDRGDRDDTIILNGTDSTSSDAGDNILFEGNAARDTNDDGGGRLMSETSHAPSGKGERVLVKRTTTKISTKPNIRTARNLSLYLAETPFGQTGAVSGIQLENSTAGSFESGALVMDGTLPFNDPNVPIILDGDGDLDHIVLDGTDGSSSNAGDSVLMEDGNRILQEDSSFVTRGLKDRVLLENSIGGVLMAESDRFAFPVGFKINENERIVLEDDHDDETINISDIGTFRFEDILRRDKIIIENGSDIGSVEQNNANAVENTGVLLENFGQLLLDGTDSTSTNANSFLIQETDKRNRFDLELSGSLIVESFSTNSVIEHLIDEQFGDSLVMEGPLSVIDSDSILLEIGDGTDEILLNGTDSDSTNAGDKVLLESERSLTSNIALETNRIISSEGQIPLGNWTLNSRTSPVGGQPIVHSSEILVRTTGDIALEDETVNNVDGVTSHGHLVLNGTDSTSSNAGDNFDLEGATGITV